MAEQLDLIHFDIDPSAEPSYSFNLYPSGDVICRTFSDLIKLFEWKHLAIIYNSKTSNTSSYIVRKFLYTDCLKFFKLFLNLNRSKKSQMSAGWASSSCS